MSVGKIGINGYNIYPDNIKKDSERKLDQNSNGKVHAKMENPKKTQNPVSHPETDFNPEVMHKEAHRTKQAIEDYITHVQSQSATINKFYPPYPPGNEDRMDLLKTFPLFRKEIARFSLEQTESQQKQAPEDTRIQELEAEMKSMEIRNTLTNSGSYGITTNQSDLTGLV